MSLEAMILMRARNNVANVAGAQISEHFVVYLYWAQQKVCDITQKTVSNDGGS